MKRFICALSLLGYFHFAALSQVTRVVTHTDSLPEGMKIPGSSTNNAVAYARFIWSLLDQTPSGDYLNSCMDQLSTLVQEELSDSAFIWFSLTKGKQVLLETQSYGKAKVHFSEALQQAQSLPSPAQFKEITKKVLDLVKARQLSEEAIALNQFTARWAKTRKDTSFWTTSLLAIGINYASLGDLEKANQYLIDAYELGIQASSPDTRIIALNARGTAYRPEEGVEKGREIIAAILQEDLEALPHNYRGLSYQSIAQIANWLEDNQLALTYNYKSLEIARKHYSVLDQAIFSFKIMVLHYLSNEWDQAIEVGEEAIEHLAGTGNTSIESRINRWLGIIYEAKGDYQKALHYQKAWVSLEDTLRLSDRRALLAQSEVKFQSSLKEAEISALEVETQLKQTEKTRMRYLIIGVIVLLTVLLFFFLKQKQLTTRIREQYTQIKQQAGRLEELDTKKSRFFQNISHELRTPLSLIYGPIKELQKSNQLSAKDQDLLQTISDQSSYSINLLNQLLHLGQVDQGHLQPFNKTLKLKEFLRSIEVQFASLARAQGISFQGELDIEEDVLVDIDVNKTQSVLHNLLSNAIKYSEEGDHITLSATILENTSLQLKVKDTGRGIPSSALPHIFDQFYRVDRLSKQEEGTGIGLALVKHYIDVMGGTIEVASEWQQGSEFTVRFPISLSKQNLAPKTTAEASALVDAAISAAPVLATHALPFKGEEELQTLLIVEDHEDLFQFIRDITSPYYTVVHAPDGQRALKLLEEGLKVDLILTDLMMPELDGWQFVDRLKAHLSWKLIPIIILTARRDAKGRLRSLQKGINDYLTKPFDPEELLLKIENLLQQQADRDEYTQAYGEEQASPPKVKKDIISPDEIWLGKLHEVVMELLPSFDLKLIDIAEEMCISIPHLHRKVKAMTGLTPMQFVQDLRFKHAKFLLEEDPYTSVKKVAYSVGFKAEKHFSRNFRKRFGKYPSEFLDQDGGKHA
ncbi:MAG: ATP-binding protein [Bacteroidota bacterium]